MISGLYERQDDTDAPFERETIALDVDGHHPQLAASGTGLAGLTFRAHWIAKPLTRVDRPDGPRWAGPIVHRFGQSGLVAWDTVSFRLDDAKLVATFHRDGVPDRERTFELRSRHFREVLVEYDREDGVPAVVDYQTDARADRPASLAGERLNVDAVFERAGLQLIRSSADSVIAGGSAGADERWNDAELHDAMQVHFSRLVDLPEVERDRARWMLWTFFARRYEDPPNRSTGGMMFDRIGGAHRQGTAIFRDSFIAEPPDGDPDPAAWRDRMAFWCTVHEMGHAFNLLHSWEKQSGAQWLPHAGNYSLLSFMNYPSLYQNGAEYLTAANTTRFFKDFSFRFTDDELLFLRHAPESFVVMGGEAWGHNSAFEQARVAARPTFSLVVRANRPTPTFEFMEPVVLELKLVNVSGEPQTLPHGLLDTTENLTIVVQRRGSTARTYHPLAHTCVTAEVHTLPPDQAMYGSLFISVDARRWLIDEPGYYSIRVCLHLPGEDIVSNRHELRVLPSRSWDEQHIAQDYFGDAVGRALTFDGTKVLGGANATLAEVAERCPHNPAATHAKVALAMPRIRHFKELARTTNPATRYVLTRHAREHTVMEGLEELLTSEHARVNAAQTLGHIDYRDYTERLRSAVLAEDGAAAAGRVQDALVSTLTARKVAPSVVARVEREDPRTAPNRPPP